MNLKVLGCGGGIGGRERYTTCLWVDDDILVDAGTGLSSLGIEQLLTIDHLFITHSHLDHVVGMALLLDAVSGKRDTPITVHASERVINSLRSHMFNWELWPDFTKIPAADRPTVRWEPMPAGATIEIKGRSITSHPVNHVVDAVGYWIHNGKSGFLFTGDTSSIPHVWETFRSEKRLAKVIVDCSFANEERDVATKSKHFCPQALIEDVRAMPKSIEFLIYHLKPGQEDQIMHELVSGGEGRKYTALKFADSFEF
ncbi:3',5'-cyclic-nucleotide phosphodiesterase [soil metagenome]